MEGAARIFPRGPTRLTASDKIALGFCIGAIAFLLCGSLVHINRIRLQVSSTKVIDPGEPLISGTGFASNAVYPSTVVPSFRGDLKLYGSWLRSNEPTGSVHTRWYKPVPEFSIFIAGYPDHAGESADR